MKIYLLVLGFLVSLLLSCSEEPYVCNCDTSSVSKNDSIIQSELKDTSRYNHFLRFWKIPALSDYNQESYRFKASHTFGHYTQIYTLIENEPGAKLIVRQYNNSLSTTVLAVIDVEYEIFLSPHEWKEIKKVIESTCFWSYPIDNKQPETLDGGQWLLEGYDPDERNCANAKHHVNTCHYGKTNNVGQVCLMIKKHA